MQTNRCSSLEYPQHLVVNPNRSRNDPNWCIEMSFAPGLMSHRGELASGAPPGAGVRRLRRHGNMAAAGRLYKQP